MGTPDRRRRDGRPPADLDEPAGFIDRIIGGDVSSADVDALIAEIEKETGESGDS